MVDFISSILFHRWTLLEERWRGNWRLDVRWWRAASQSPTGLHQELSARELTQSGCTKYRRVLILPATDLILSHDNPYIPWRKRSNQGILHACYCSWIHYCVPLFGSEEVASVCRHRSLTLPKNKLAARNSGCKWRRRRLAMFF